MTSNHRAALHKSINARHKAKQAMRDAAERLANERAAASEREMALRHETDSTRKEKAGNG